MQNIPLFFRFQQVVCGKGFLADVQFEGRATCAREFGSTWIHGVNPGAIAEEGTDMKSAYANFRSALVGVFFDLAEEAGSFEELCAAARSFYEATDRDSVAEWEEARQQIRQGADPGMDAELDLRRESGEPDTGFRVIEVLPGAISPALNHFAPDQPSRLAA